MDGFLWENISIIPLAWNISEKNLGLNLFLKVGEIGDLFQIYLFQRRGKQKRF